MSGRRKHDEPADGEASRPGLRREGHEALIGNDGERLRPAGPWVGKKLAFLEFFAPHAIDAAANRERRVYVDLFAGPGRYLVRETDSEVEAGCLALLRARGARRGDLAFTHAHLVNLDRADTRALESRVNALRERRACLMPRGDIRLHTGDANALARRLLTQADKLDYLLVAAEIEAPRQLPWDTVRHLRAGGHRNLDLWLLFPLDLGLPRLTSWRTMPDGHEEMVTRFFGDESWKPILEEEVTEARLEECREALEALYREKLGSLWEKVEPVMQVKLSDARGLSRMLFATDRAAGARIAEWAHAQADTTDQLGFGF